MAEWLGSGLQSRVHGFDSRRRLAHGLWGSSGALTARSFPGMPERRRVRPLHRIPCIGVRPGDRAFLCSGSDRACEWSAGLWQADPVRPPPGPPTRYSTSVPLGGVEPTPPVETSGSEVRDLLAAAVLLVAAVVTALASLLSWQDFGRALDPDENGWRLADGSFGRGWVAVLVAVVLAVAGVLLLVGRRQAARWWARIGTAALVVGPVVEWAFGSSGSRTGPGIGLWLLLGTGLVLVVTLAVVLPHEHPGRAAG